MAQKESIHHGILLQCQDDIQSLIANSKLDGIASDSVRVRKVPIGLNLKTNPGPGEVQAPAIVICPFGRTYEQINNFHDEIGYRVGIATVAADNQDLEGDEYTLEQHLGWLETIEDQFRTRRLLVSTLVTPADCVGCRIDAALSYQFSQFVANWAAGSTVLTFFHRKARGN